MQSPRLELVLLDPDTELFLLLTLALFHTRFTSRFHIVKKWLQDNFSCIPVQQKGGKFLSWNWIKVLSLPDS